MTARFFKTSSEITFFYCWLIFLLNVLTDSNTGFGTIPCIMVLLGALILNLSDILKVQKPVLRKIIIALGLIFPIFTFLMERHITVLIVSVLPWFYYCFVFFSGRQETYYKDYVQRFKIMSMLLTPILFFAVTIPEMIGVYAMGKVYPWIIMYVISGILALQNLRWKGTSFGKGHYEKRQFGELLLFSVFSGFLTMTDYIEKLNTLLVEKVIEPAVKMLVGGSLGIVYNILMFFAGLTEAPNNSDIVSGDVTMTPEITATLPPAGEYTPTPTPTPVPAIYDENLREKEIYILLFIIAFGILLALVTRKVLKKNPGNGSDIREIIKVDNEKKSKRKKKDTDSVRTLYKKHMKQVAQKKELYKSDTTEDIAEKAVSSGIIDAESEEIVKENYRQARYNEEVSEERIKTVKKLLK